MKKIISIVSVVASLVFLTYGLAFAIPGITYKVVEGTGVYPDDVNKVQNAVNGGGNILLKGTFNFGNWSFPTPPSTPTAPQRVTIKNDVCIFGERDHKGTPLTKINGGYFTFYSPLPSTTVTPPFFLPSPLLPGPKITIQGIHFDGALWAPIHIAYSSGATITGNKITQVVPFGNGSILFDPSFPGFKYLNVGILCGTFYAQSGFSSGKIYREGAVTGPLEIKNNFIDLETTVPGNNLSQGIFVNWTTGIIAKISDNTIRNVSRNSIEVLDNYVAKGIGLIMLEGNEITTSEVGIPYPSEFTPNGIILGWFLNPAGYDKANNCLHTVMHNAIRIKGNTSVGIMALADGAVVLNNNVVSEGASARGLVILGSNSYVAHNKIEGTGNYAIDVLPTPPGSLRLDASNNFFQGNNYNLFDARLFDLHFAPGANHNVFVGHSGNVLDEGEGNRITNFNYRGKGLGLGTKSNYTLSGRRGR
jgi:hypothetical protein